MKKIPTFDGHNSGSNAPRTTSRVSNWRFWEDKNESVITWRTVLKIDNAKALGKGHRSHFTEFEGTHKSIYGISKFASKCQEFTVELPRNFRAIIIPFIATWSIHMYNISGFAYHPIKSINDTAAYSLKYFWIEDKIVYSSYHKLLSMASKFRSCPLLVMNV